MNVIVYSTPSCPYCNFAKDFLKEKGVEFEEIDVSKDQEKAKEMVEKSGQMGVPVIEIGDKIIIGFKKEEMEKALEDSTENTLEEGEEPKSGCDSCFGCPGCS